MHYALLLEIEDGTIWDMVGPFTSRQKVYEWIEALPPDEVIKEHYKWEILTATAIAEFKAPT